LFRDIAGEPEQHSMPGRLRSILWALVSYMGYCPPVALYCYSRQALLILCLIGVAKEIAGLCHKQRIFKAWLEIVPWHFFSYFRCGRIMWLTHVERCHLFLKLWKKLHNQQAFFRFSLCLCYICVSILRFAYFSEHRRFL